MTKLISLNNISKTFFSSKGETKVLDSISFDLYRDEIVTILGPSGCGKSTILNILSELEEPTNGNISTSSKMGYMFQKDNLLEWRNILNNVLLNLEITHQKTENNINYAKDLLQKYHLSNFENYYPYELSGGMRQRVALIRTLVSKPDILLLDEPFSALDFQTKLLVQNDVYNIIKNEKKTALIVSHDINEAISLSDRIIILSNRPCQIKKIIYLDFEKNLSPIERRKNIKFNEYYNQIYDLLNKN